MNWLRTIIANRIRKQPTEGKCEQCSTPITVCDTSGKIQTLCCRCEQEALKGEGGFNV